MERQELLNDIKKRDNTKVIQERMAKTFSCRRLEVVSGSPAAADFKERWPALFCEAEVGRLKKCYFFNWELAICFQDVRVLFGIDHININML